MPPPSSSLLLLLLLMHQPSAAGSTTRESGCVRVYEIKRTKSISKFNMQNNLVFSLKEIHIFKDT